jgi:IPT/TIG domain
MGTIVSEEERSSKVRRGCLGLATTYQGYRRMVNGVRVGILLCLFALSVPGQDIVLSNATVSSGTVSYEPAGAITAGPSYVINGTAVVTFSAGTQVNLEPGFHVIASSGSLFDARPGVQLSGQILANGTGLSGVSVTLTGTTANGGSFAETVVTNSAGGYAFNVPAGGTYALVPALSGYSFSPASQTFTNVLAAIQVQTSTAAAGPSSPPPPTISGLSLPGGPPLMGFVITGANFGSSQGSSTVSFNGTNFTVLTWNPDGGHITVQIPATTPIADSTLTVKVGNQTATANFSVTAAFGCSN